MFDIFQVRTAEIYYCFGKRRKASIVYKGIQLVHLSESSGRGQETPVNIDETFKRRRYFRSFISIHKLTSVRL